MSELDLMRPMLAFATVVDAGSFRGAADRMGVSAPYVSQMVSDLEARLGRQLLYRSTRRLALTPEGDRVLPHARTMAAAFADGIATLRDTDSRLGGRLRITAPTVLATPVFARILAAFADRHPGIRLEVDLEDRAVDPVAAQVDLALRIGGSRDDPRLARRLYTTRGILCAAPALAEKITSPDDLGQRTWLRSPATSSRLTLTHDGGHQHQSEPSRQMVIGNAALIRAMLAEGAGYALWPEFAVQEALRDGVLVQVLPGWQIPSVDVFALYTERRTALTNARAFVDHLQARLQARG